MLSVAKHGVVEDVVAHGFSLRVGVMVEVDGPSAMSGARVLTREPGVPVELFAAASARPGARCAHPDTGPRSFRGLGGFEAEPAADSERQVLSVDHASSCWYSASLAIT